MWFSRYALAFLDTGSSTINDSYVKGNSFNYNFNSALGIFGTNNLLVENNVIYFALGSGIRVWGKINRIIHNLVVYSASEATYKGRRLFDLHWPGAIETESSLNSILIDNAVGMNFIYLLIGICFLRNVQKIESFGGLVGLQSMFIGGSLL